MRYEQDVVEIDPTMPPVERLDVLMEWVLADSRRPDVIDLSRAIVSDAIARGSASPDDPVSHLQALLDWQQRAVRYQEDPTDPATGQQKELFKRAYRAISDREDDCEGKVTVYCTMATAVGYAAMPAWIEQPRARNNHVAALSAVPAWAARSLPTPGDYPSVVILPSIRPHVAGATWAWAETTLGDVVTPAGLVRGPLVGEHPFDVLARFRAVGVARVHL